MELSGWGRYPVLDCRVARLRRCEELGDLLARNRTLIARGNGRSYGDAALNAGADPVHAGDGPAAGVRPGHGAADVPGGGAAVGHPGDVRPPGLVSPGGSRHRARHRRRHDRSRRAWQEPSPRRLFRRPRGVPDAGDGGRRDPALQPLGPCGSLPRDPGRHGPDRRDPVRALSPAPRRLRFPAGGNRRHAGPRRHHGVVRGVGGPALQRGLDRRSGARRQAGALAGVARRVAGAGLAARASRGEPPARCVSSGADNPRRCAVRAAQSDVDPPVQRAALRSGARARRRAPGSLRIVLLSPGPHRGVEPAVRAAGFRAVPVRAAEGGEPARRCGAAGMRRGGGTGSVPHGAQAVRAGRRGDDVLPPGGLYPGPGLPDALRHPGVAEPPRRHHPCPRRAGISRQGRLLRAGTRAAGLSPPRRVSTPYGPRGPAAQTGSPRRCRGGSPCEEPRDRADHRRHVGHRPRHRPPPRPRRLRVAARGPPCRGPRRRRFRTCGRGPPGR